MACLLMAMTTGYAQEAESDADKLSSDTLEVKGSITEAFGLGDLGGNDLDTTGFDARKFLGQKRYIPENKSFIKKKKWNDHLFVDIAGGGLWFDNTAGSRRLKNGFLGNLYIGKDFTSVHSARVGAGFSRFTDGTSKKDFKNFELRGDYLCNFSSMLNGYQEKRWLDVSAIAGLSYYRCTLHEDATNAFGANFGLQFLIKAGSNTGVTIEPSLAVVSDKFDLKERNNRHGTNLIYGVKIGLKYIFTDENLSWPRDTANYWMKNTFIEASTGANTSLDTDLPLARALGSKYTVAAGKWLTPGIGLRAGITAAENRWKNSLTLADAGEGVKKAYVREEMATHAGFRFEAMLNPLGFGDPAKYDRYKPFQFNISFGGELGWMTKADHDNKGNKQHLKCNYMGLTAALQFLYQVENDVALFIEPRYTLLNYDIPYTNRPDLSEEYNDNLFSLNAGVRMYAPTKEERKQNDKFRSLFEPGFYAAVEGGVCNLLQLRRFDDTPIRVGLTGGLAGGYRLNPIFSGRVGISYAQIHTTNLYDYREYVGLPTGGVYPMTYHGLWDRTMSVLAFTAAAEVNLSNLYMGYSLTRKFDLSVHAGPSILGVIGSQDQLYDRERPIGESEIDGGSVNDVTIGLEAGLSVSYALNDKIRLYLQPKAGLFGKEFMEGSGAGMSGMSCIFSTFVGASYQF